MTQQDLPMEDNNEPVEVETIEEEVQEDWSNSSDNPWCQMFCVDEGMMILLEKHKTNMEMVFYDYYQKFKGLPLWSVKASVVPVEALKPAQVRIYNDYVKACREQQKQTDIELYAVNLDFDIDSSG